MFDRFIKVALSAISVVAFGVHFSAPASAKWYEASSDNFVIYADDSEKDLRRYAENLERFHRSLEVLTGRKVPKPSPSNRVTVFVVGSQREVRKLSGQRYTAGFYVPRAGASRAFVQDIRNKNGYPDFSTIVLMHEYAHHFFISALRYEMPRWLSEGMAEFYAAASFQKDGGVLIGRVARHRAAELAYSRDVTVQELLDEELYRKRHKKGYNAFYGRAWLLYHYLQFHPERRDQIDAYARAVFSGMDPFTAGEQVFGDLGQLQRELDQYMRGRRFSMLTLEAKDLPIGPVSLRPLSEGEAEVMPLRIRSQRGVSREQALELLPEVREVAAKFPEDAAVLSALAEAEHDAGNDDAAIAAADRAIAIDPTRVNAYVQKGFSLFRKASEALDAEKAFEAAMAPFTALNAIENDHPLPLMYYYRSYAQRGVAPPENARHALERAAQLAPFDKGLWFQVAMLQMQEGKIALAKSALQPIANDPHGGVRAERTKALIALLETLPEGKPVDMRLARETEKAVNDADSAGTGEE